MAMTERIPGEINYGGFVDAVGGIATIVLTVIALAGVRPELFVAIVTIIFGAALLVQGGAMLSEYAHVYVPTDTLAEPNQFGVGGISALFLIGAAGIVLGVLALLGIYPVELTAIAAIAFGGALVVSSNSVWNLYMLKQASMRDARFPSQMLAGQMASGSAGIQALAGLAAIVLGILAVVGIKPVVLTLVALLVLGATIVLTGSALSGAVLSFMRPSPQSARGSMIAGGATFGGAE
ncbi:MAG TPA: hypothetical protein VH934_17415 [Xanthobacteraceae bacterium]|jgi:hypothetical protein